MAIFQAKRGLLVSHFLKDFSFLSCAMSESDTWPEALYSRWSGNWLAFPKFEDFVIFLIKYLLPVSTVL